MRYKGICGISRSFPLLSRCERQVAHALLTRPPLSHILALSENFTLIRFVRLACVKHAASVHPEPGSNSLFDSLILPAGICFLVTSFFFGFVP